MCFGSDTRGRGPVMRHTRGRGGRATRASTVITSASRGVGIAAEYVGAVLAALLARFAVLCAPTALI
jgi:hypothetical protein